MSDERLCAHSSEKTSFRSTNGDMTWEFVITNPAVRDLGALHRTELEAIDEAFEAMRTDPYGATSNSFAVPAMRCADVLAHGVFFLNSTKTNA